MTHIASTTETRTNYYCRKPEWNDQPWAKDWWMMAYEKDVPGLLSQGYVVRKVTVHTTRETEFL